jgi:hypothetical protein
LILGWPTQFVCEVINGKNEITRESAAQIGAVLGQAAEMWLSLLDQYPSWVREVGTLGQLLAGGDDVVSAEEQQRGHPVVGISAAPGDGGTPSS